ncbi:MAG TPA: aromatic ring-hydroxylating dioxygenase subunit alpha [Alphaproteobacteria bacterium]|nr:aromatic ring-hydroxylating dioxygenase subunit alpha [Alphaproteobacteria bacterium]
MAEPSRFRDPSRQPDQDGLSMPGWIYRDADFLEAEREAVFAGSWQIVCHENDIPEAGDYHTLDFMGDSFVVVRDKAGTLNAFHNVCRHRAARLLDGTSGRCKGSIVCPYHAWNYGYDGRLNTVPFREKFPDLDLGRTGLAPLEVETFLGFVFVRQQPGGPSVAEMMAPYRAELEPYRLPELKALGRVTLRRRAVNWKNVGDNYSDALHITVAHPGLTRLFGRSYGAEAREWVDKMWGDMRAEPSANISERLYQKFLPEAPHLPPERQRKWAYYKLWPNMAFDIYPDQVDFMQFFPISPTETLIREIAYVLPEAYTPPERRREMRAARYLNWRINRMVSLEDKALIERVQAGMASRSYTVGPLAETEVCLRSFGRRMRNLIPESRLEHAPAPGWARRRN